MGVRTGEILGSRHTRKSFGWMLHTRNTYRSSWALLPHAPEGCRCSLRTQNLSQVSWWSHRLCTKPSKIHSGWSEEKCGSWRNLFYKNRFYKNQKAKSRKYLKPWGELNNFKPNETPAFFLLLEKNNVAELCDSFFRNILYFDIFIQRKYIFINLLRTKKFLFNLSFSRRQRKQKGA